MDADTAIRICSQGLPYVLREEQVQALQALCRGQDTFISLPTGYGKSEVFTLFPTVMDKVGLLRYILIYIYKCDNTAGLLAIH